MSETESKPVRQRLRLSRAQLIGLAFVMIGILALVLAYNLQTRIDKIGDTNDPLLKDRISRLESQRDLSVVTAIGVLFIGFFAIAMLVEPSNPSLITQNQMIAAARMANGILAGLSLAGNSSYLPAKHGLTKERVFVPTAKAASVPPSALSDDLVLSPGKDGSSPGIIVEPFGLRLLNTIEVELETSVKNVGVESTEGTLQILKHGFGIMRDFHFKERDGKTILRVEYGGLLDACRTVRKEKPDTCRQLQCFGCACLLTAAARATGKIVSVEAVDNGKDSVEFTLSLKEW